MAMPLTKISSASQACHMCYLPIGCLIGSVFTPVILTRVRAKIQIKTFLRRQLHQVPSGRLGDINKYIHWRYQEPTCYDLRV